MAKRIILTKQQLDEICGGDSSYLDGLALKPDMGDVNSIQISADGVVDNGYADNTTSDDFADMNHDLGYFRGTRTIGSNSTNIHEMSARDWMNKNVLGEESEHGNERLKHKTFGASENEDGKSYDATKMALSRYNKAKEKALNGNPEEKIEGENTINKMKSNWGNIDLASQQYETAKFVDSNLQDSKPEGTKIKSAPKQSGNGKAHSPKNGIITYFE